VDGAFDPPHEVAANSAAVTAAAVVAHDRAVSLTGMTVPCRSREHYTPRARQVPVVGTDWRRRV
jgi:hypothetical protein